MAVYRGQYSALLTAALLFGALMLSVLLGLEFSNHLNAKRKQDKFMAYSEEVREVNGLMETLEARFEVSSLEVQALRNRSLRMAGARRRQADTDTAAR